MFGIDTAISLFMVNCIDIWKLEKEIHYLTFTKYSEEKLSYRVFSTPVKNNIFQTKTSLSYLALKIVAFFQYDVMIFRNQIIFHEASKKTLIKKDKNQPKV